MVRAAIIETLGSPVRLVDLAFSPLGPDQVRVRIAATGLCHSDLSLARGRLRQPLPVVLGHETAGQVLSVGTAVANVAPGDRVVLCWAPPCGHCWYCTASEPWLCEHAADGSATPYAEADGVPVYAGLSTAGFAEETVVAASALIPVPDDVPLQDAALVGCAVMTGVGAVTNTARTQPGETVVVIGLGGVGLSAVQGARIARAGQVIAVDRSEDKLQLALTLGASHTLLASDDLPKQVRALTSGRGADVVLDCVGTPDTIKTAWSAARRGGRCILVGIAGRDESVSFSALQLFHFARAILPCVYGSADPRTEMPRLLQLAATGELNLQALVTGTTGLDGIDEAFARMERGEGVRTLVVP